MSATPSSFADAAGAYHKRVSYPLRLFAQVAERFLPEKPGRLLDLGAGTGRLSTGFSPYFAECLLVDSSPEMLAKARRRKYAEDCRISFLCTKAEDLQAELGPFDAVAIGRALHLLPREPTLQAIERVTAPGGLILICEAGSFPDERNPWYRPYRRTHKKYRFSGPRVGDTDPEGFFRDSPFSKVDHLLVTWKREVSVDDLVERAFSYSTTTRAVLGESVAAELEAELRQVLQPFEEGQKITEIAFSYTIVFRRD